MKLLHEALTENALQVPEKTALIYKDDTLSYRELELISNRLSRVCNEAGAGAEDRIGIYIDKSIESIIAIFGILKSGACYVPLDPLSPDTRQVLIVNNCSLKYLVTTSAKLRNTKNIAMQAKNIKYVFVLDKTREQAGLSIPGVTMFFKDDIMRQPGDTHEKPEKLSPDSLAYILYTSGSTGQPKGVMLSHRAALAFVDWCQKTFNIKESDIVSSHAPLHFDLSIFDIFVSLSAGAAICLVPQGWSAFPRSIADLIEKRKISTWYSVPSILTQLVLHGNLEKRHLPALRQILFAGEVFPSKYLRQLMNLIPDAEYFNLYGPTETNVIAYYNVKEPPANDKSIPIGGLCDNVKSYVVDIEGNIVENGETGELFVECPTLMDGYWKDKEKSREVLRQNPYDTSSSNRLYKTGDLVNWNEQGLLDYHGRCDSMIKIRGYRIELGEIETILSAHPAVKEAAVTAVPDDETGNRIKAVVVPKSGKHLNGKDLIVYCSEKLPYYMVPEIVNSVNALPRTSTGKIDRKKLSDPGL